MEFDIVLKGQTYQGTLPASFAARDDILSSAVNNWRRASCAALGICSPPSLKIKATLTGAGYSPLEFGGRVLDDLMGRGFSRGEIIAAGVLCWNKIAESMPTEGEVKEKEDFLDQDAADSTL